MSTGRASAAETRRRIPSACPASFLSPVHRGSVKAKTGEAPKLPSDTRGAHAPAEERSADAEVGRSCVYRPAAPQPFQCPLPGNEERSCLPVGFRFVSGIPQPTPTTTERWNGRVFKD